MLLAQLAQALMVKYSSATFAMLCTALVVPTCAVAFSLPMVMGSKVEQLSGATPWAVLLVFIGILGFRLSGDDTESEKVAPVVPEDKESGLTAESAKPKVKAHDGLASACVPLLPGDDRGQGPTVAPRISVGVGIIASEYNAARHAPVEIWEEGTLREKERKVSE